MLKKTLAGITAAAVLGVGGVAFAASDTGAVPPKLQSSANGQQGSNRHAGRHAGRHGRHGRLGAIAAEAARVIGVDVATLRAGVAADGSIAAVATQRGVEPQRVIDALVIFVNTNIEKAVAAGRLDAAQAAKIKAKVPARVAVFVNDTMKVVDNRRAHRSQRQGERQQQILKTASSALGITSEELASQLANKLSIADVATDHKVALSTVVDALTSAATAKIDTAVRSGRVTSDRATSIKSHLASRIDRLVHRRGFRSANAHPTATVEPTFGLSPDSASDPAGIASA